MTSIDLFPQGLDQSILVAVWVSLLVRLALTETLGWTFVGLVVPGYLASLLVVHPVAAAVVVGEAVLTHAVVRLCASAGTHSGAWSSFFGRDRFFLILVVGVFVRQVSEMWLLPAVLGQLDAVLGTHHALDRDLFSIGLVLVPLTANLFWTTGLRRGAFQVGVPVALTFAVVKLVLIAHTNLSFSSLELVYEDVALDFLRSPKAYIVLLLGALVGARVNLRYGWNSGGILVPALLAVACFTPLRLVTTAAEAIAVAFAVSLLLRTPLGHLNIEGPRRIVLVFSIGFALKLGLGWAIAPAVETAKVSDFFGFGYVLPSLLALKILDGRAAVRIVLPTFQVATFSLVAASLIGLGLDRIAPVSAAPTIDPAAASDADPLMTTALGCMAAARVRAAIDASPGRAVSARERAGHAALWTEIARWLERGGEPPAGLRERARALGLALAPLADRGMFALYEPGADAARRGWPIAVVRPAGDGPVLAVPDPGELPTAEAAAALCDKIACRAVIAGDDRQAIAALAPRAAVELRADPRAPAGLPQLHLPGPLPAGLHLARWPRVASTWEPLPAGIHARADGRTVLRARPADLAAIAVDGAPPPPPIQARVSVAARLAAAIEIDPAPVYAPPSRSEVGLLELTAAQITRGDASSLGRADAAFAHRMAGLAGYRLERLADGAGRDRAAWLLVETVPRGRGAIAIRRERLYRGPAAPNPRPELRFASRSGGDRSGKPSRSPGDHDIIPLAVEIPHPRREPGTFRLGVELWAERDGRALIVAGADDAAADAADPDPVRAGRPLTAFHGFHQAAHRALAGARDSLIVQLRGFDAEREIDADVVIGLGAPVLDPHARAELAPALLPLVDGPQAWFARWRLADTSAATFDLTGASSPQIEHARRTGMAAAVLWCSPSVRAAYSARRGREVERLVAAGLPLIEVSPIEALTLPALAGDGSADSTALADAVALAVRYAAERNVHQLAALAGRAHDRGVRVWAAIAPELGAPFLIVDASDTGERRRALILIDGHPGAATAASARDAETAVARRHQIITASPRGSEGEARALPGAPLPAERSGRGVRGRHAPEVDQ